MTTSAKIRVLVIDDDEISREYQVSVLERTGCIVHNLPTAIGATNLLLREDIQVVVLDVLMPSLPGDKLAVLLRKNRQLAGLGVVLVSSCPRAELEQIALEVNADALVGKHEIRAALPKAVAHAAHVRSMRARYY